MTTLNVPPRATSSGYLVVPLLKGVVYRAADPTRWVALGRLQGQVRDYVAVIGLELVMDDAEGYAFLRTPPGADDEADDALPRLVARRRLTYGVSLLLALLRKRLAEADAEGGDDAAGADAATRSSSWCPCS